MSDAEDDLFGTADVDGWGRPVVQAINHPNLETLLAEALHEECLVSWEARRRRNPELEFTQHAADAHIDMARYLLSTPAGKHLQSLYDAVIALREADGPHWLNLLDELFDIVDATGEVL